MEPGEFKLGPQESGPWIQTIDLVNSSPEPAKCLYQKYKYRKESRLVKFVMQKRHCVAYM